MPYQTIDKRTGQEVTRNTNKEKFAHNKAIANGEKQVEIYDTSGKPTGKFRNATFLEMQRAGIRADKNLKDMNRAMRDWNSKPESVRDAIIKSRKS